MTIVKVEYEWNGHDIHRFRLTLPDGRRELIRNKGADNWDRSASKKALDLLENVYGYNRRNVRFEVR